jgi:DNA-binding MarR family transcriptional regulator
MTKQAAGQFVGYLEGTGHLQVRTDGADRRRRVVSRTARGDAAVAAVEAHLADLEARWSERVGAERYRAFREVLLQLPDL